MRVRESTVERALADAARKAGGRAYKWVSPGAAGVMDRLLLLPGHGRAVAVEVKAPGSHMRPLQLARAKELLGIGGLPVYCVDSVEAATGLVEALMMVGEVGAREWHVSLGP